MANQIAARKVDRDVDTTLQPVLIVAGAALLVVGSIAAFTNSDGVATAALLAAGLGVLVVGYLGRYITRIKYRELEVSLEKTVQDFQAHLELAQHKADVAVKSLESIARSYEAVRSQMHSGGDRDSAMERDVIDAMIRTREETPSPEQLRAWSMSSKEGDRIVLLGALKADPTLWDFELLRNAIEHPCDPFDHDRFLALAADMLPIVNPDQRTELRKIVEEQRNSQKIKDTHIRWHTSARLLRLLNR